MEKKTKIIITLAFIITIIASFAVGCHASETNTADISGATTITAEAAESKFELVQVSIQSLDSRSDVSYYREASTDVVYMLYDGYNSGGLTVMLDPETGKPLTYENWKANYQNK